MSDRILGTIAGVLIALLLCGAVMVNAFTSRLLDQGAARVCRVEAMNPGATVIVKIEQPEPCDSRAMAREAREAVQGALATATKGGDVE